MEGISVLIDDAILYMLQYLDTHDRIAFANTCERFRQICIDGRVFRKLDLSERLILRTQQTAINEFFRDRQMAQHIRELNLSNHRILNWKMNAHLEEFIMLICPHLEALHVVNCGMSFQTLHRILKQAPKLIALSWSLLDLNPAQDIKFLMNGMKSSDGMCLKNIKHLHLEILESKLHIQILSYLVLSHCYYVEDLEIYKWKPNEAYRSEPDLEFVTNSEIPAFPQPSTSISDTLPRLHSLIVAQLGNSLYSSISLHTRELSNFILSVVRKKARETKWKKLWIATPIDGNIFHDMYRLIVSTEHPHELHSVEAFIACARPSLDAGDDLKTLFEKIDDNSLKTLELDVPNSQTNFLEICKLILRTGGHALKFLRFFVHPMNVIDPEANLFFNTLFSGCLNIKDLDLLECHFEDNIFEALSKLKYLDRIKLQECAIHPKHNENPVEIKRASMLTFVENCKNVTELEVYGCVRYDHHLEDFSSRSIDEDLMAIVKLRKLKSLTLHEVSGIKQWTFLQNISEHCKFLTMLRISAFSIYFDKSCIPIILESARFLKHLAITVPEMDLGLEDPWKLLSRARNLERLCITCMENMGSPSISGAVEMLKSLPRLHVLHLHSFHAENVEFFRVEIARRLQEEESDYSFCFEFVEHDENVGMVWVSSETLPLNAVELCYMTPVLEIPTF